MIDAHFFSLNYCHMLRIKLVKTGKKDAPTWRVVVVEHSKTGRGAVTEYIGNYNPHLRPKQFQLNSERYAYWVGTGAQPTDAVLRLKGRFIDKTKEYQEIVKPKVYKSKKAVAVPKDEATKEPSSKAVDEQKDEAI